MENQNTFRVLLALLIIFFVAHRGYYHKKLAHLIDATPKAKKDKSSSVLANVMGLAAGLSVLAYIINPQWMSWSTLQFPVWLRWLGLGMALVGFVLLQWSQKTLGQNWSSEPRLLEGQELVTGGPYRWIRHPIYTAFILIATAPLLISANWSIGCLLIGMIAIDIASRITTEESLMMAQFGDEYRTYMQSTGRLIPRLRGASDRRN